MPCLAARGELRADGGARAAVVVVATLCQELVYKFVGDTYCSSRERQWKSKPSGPRVVSCGIVAFCCLWRADQCGMRRDKLWWGSSSSSLFRLSKQRPAKPGLTNKLDLLENRRFLLDNFQGSQDKQKMPWECSTRPHLHKSISIRLSINIVVVRAGTAAF